MMRSGKFFTKSSGLVKVIPLAVGQEDVP
jgi:hypothetical protein